MHFKFLIPITLATILAFKGAVQFAPVPQNVSQSIIGENTPAVSNASTISNQTIEETAAPVSSLLDDENSHDIDTVEKDNSDTKKTKKKSKGMNGFIIFCIAFPVSAIEYFFRSLALLIINFIYYLIVWPIKAFFNLCFVKRFFATLATPFIIKEYPPRHESNNGNNSNEKAIVNCSGEEEGTTVKRSQVEQYMFDERKLHEIANSVFSPELQCCAEFIRDDLYAAHPEHLLRLHPCSICLEHFLYEDILLLLPCDHVIHLDCLHDFKRASLTPNSNQVAMVRCPTCQLNLVRLYQYYIDHGLDFKEVKFDNRA
ncbi:E3 ubiquitin-protein ligase [Wickerhamomyces ciferrii]|uniref:E3 ubiquitin-protein ligase n=1 Tax=Wickerhamomyces ciferrii (strain ATCC 14091 / BCRC 22168 / CBS 111 / JCM 3599 / NBRC 0793 / NRRL Y-1031 F-60-10) TaxID=1206466 RepID=K0KHR1_WICCF|nr:E3 ubiquitin-protein ligase [Wickerhamomyces ciferrii]CCH40698.1 E3 ubiquitin-protein ligase [Wickerhamomyces ciferrii]